MGGKPAVRKPRVDGERNRARLLEVAKAAFAETGADTSLDAIAKRAGFGIGTLYRHFPTRDALIEAVYRNEVEKLSEAAGTLAATLPPIEALRAWLVMFVDHVAAKKLIASALNEIAGGPGDLYASSSAQMKAAIALLTDHAVANGDARLGLDPLDLLRALANVPHASALSLIDILVAGIAAPRA
jgi:AcrR family transcriptional regulator